MTSHVAVVRRSTGKGLRGRKARERKRAMGRLSPAARRALDRGELG